MKPGWSTSSLWRQLSRAAALIGPSVDRIERVARTAERVSGMRRDEFTLRTSVVKEHRSKVIQLHDVIPAFNLSEGKPLLRIFDKCAARSNEYRFYRIISGQQMVRGPISPALYAAWETGFRREGRRYTVLLESLPRRGLSNLSAATANCLAERISDISTIQRRAGFEDRRTGAMSEHLLSSFVAQAAEAGEIGDTLDRERLTAMMEGWQRVQAIADRELPLIPSHNDLAPRNTCQLAAEGGIPRFVFIDWEAFGLNFAGADLHHFLRLAVVRPAYAPFFEELRRHYFERMHDVHGYDRVATDIGAHVYALYRSMLRAVNKKKGPELQVAMAIYAKLTTLLGLTSSDVNRQHRTK